MDRISEAATSRKNDALISLSPPLVGRKEEMVQLKAALDRTARNCGGTILLSGEFGIGKTRLALEALSLAKSRRFLVLEGQAHPLESGLAYGVILDAFGPFLHSLDPARRTRLINGLPDLGRLFSGLNLPSAEPLGDPALEKSRLFESAAHLLRRLSREAPVVLFLDDLHWADPASLEMLHHISRGLADQPVLLLGTYRVDSADAPRGLRQLLESPRRAGFVDHLTIPRLSHEATEALVESILGDVVPSELLAVLESRAAGVPFFVQALIRALIDSGQLVRGDEGWLPGPQAAAVIPAAVRDLILDGLDHLECSDRRIVDLIAVSGDATSHAILCAASGLNEEDLLDAIKRLTVAGLLVEEVTVPHVAYRFTHPLIQEVAYTELPEMARRRAHAILAGVIERMHPGDLDRMARHYLSAAGDMNRGRALDVLLAAGERAWNLHANYEASRYFGAALRLVREGHRPREGSWHAEPLLATLLERLGEVWERIGEGAAAAHIWKEALKEYANVGDVRGVARIRRMLSLVEWSRGDFESAQSHLAAGLEMLAGEAPCQELADLYLTQFDIVRRLGDTAGLVEVGTRLAELSEKLGSSRLQAAARLAEVMLLMEQKEYEVARADALGVLASAEADGDMILMSYAGSSLATIHFSLGEHAVGRQYAESCLTLARRLRVPILEMYPRSYIVIADLLVGAWDQAARGSIDAVTIARRIASQPALVGALSLRAIVLALRGYLEEAEGCLSEAREVRGCAPTMDRIFTLLHLAEMVVAIEQRDAIRARSAALSTTRISELSHVPPLSMSVLAEALVVAGKPEHALEVAAGLAQFGRSGSRYAAALVARAEGLALGALGEVDVALNRVWCAAEIFDELSMPFEAARARLDWASFAASNTAAGIVPILQASLNTFQRLGAHRYEETVRRLLRQLGARLPAARRSASQNGMLSERELDVALLIAEGMTTPEIAQRLVISPRTVSNHLDRIYARLGIKSRAALARYVTEAGLLRVETRNVPV